MKTILKISPPDSISPIIWEHLLKSTVAFTGAFLLFFYAPMFLNGRRRHHESASKITIQFYEFLAKHPEIQVGISLLIVLIYNLLILRKNARMNRVVTIEIDGDFINFQLSNVYFRKIVSLTLPLQELEIVDKIKKSDTGETSRKLQFVNSRTSNIIGIIHPEHFLWNDQLKDIRSALREMNQLNVRRKSKRKTYNSLVGSAFKRR